jgi:hypothetical protein
MSSSLPLKYKDFSNVFEKKNVDRLPDHRLYDCPIDLEDGDSPLALSMGYLNLNLRPFKCTLKKTSQKVSFTIPNLQPDLLSYL